jgi:hypothetical protein
LSWLGEDKIQPILAFSLPRTLKQLRAFWRVTGYYRIWIPGYSDLGQPLYQALREAPKHFQLSIEWDNAPHWCFSPIKKSSNKGPCLKPPYSR